MAEAVNIGLKEVYYATLIADVASGASWNAPVALIGAITANINPNAAAATLFADDGPMFTASTLGNIELELNLAYLSLAIQAALLGHDAPSAGILTRKADSTPPWLAIGFKTIKSNGKYRFVWMLKGKFMEPAQNAQTKTDAINWQTPTITCRFVKLDHDGAWQRHADEDDSTWSASTGTNWFTTGPSIGA